MNVALEDVRVRRDGRDVLRVPRLSMRSGRTTAVLGPNGAGKTTLLRVVAGLERPDDGRVLVGGVTPDPRRGAVGYVFQENVFLRRTLLENLTLGLTARGVAAAEAPQRAMASMRLLGIEGLADRCADRVSGGEARRASIARALCLRPPVLLLDEPLAGLDGVTYTRLLEELPPIIAGSGATTLVVSHRRDEAFSLCDDVIVLIGGVVRAAGTKHEVGADPRFADVAEVLGYVVLERGGRMVAIPEGELSLSATPTDMAARVVGVLDLVDEWRVIVTIGGTRARMRLPRSQSAPEQGGTVWLEAGRFSEVS
jgi:ABC-type sulfate/molybdate transport systems ATPase subunit